MVAVQNYMEGKIFINYGGDEGGGFSEIVKQNVTDYATANTNLGLITTERAHLLPYNAQVVHATNSLKAVKNDSSIPTGYSSQPILLDAEADATTDSLCNDRDVGLLFRFDTGVGKQQNKLLRMIRDSWVEDDVTSLTLADINAPFTPAVTAPADASALAIANYMNTLAYYTAFFNPGLYQFDPLPAAKTFGWDVLPWTQVQYVRVGNRQMGRGYSVRKSRRKARI